MHNDDRTRVLSLFWNFSVGGVAQYAAVLEGVCEYAPVSIRSFSVLGPNHHANHALMKRLGDKVIVNRSSLLDLEWLRALRKQLRDWQPDIVMSHGFNSHFMAQLCAIISKTPFRPVCSYHGLYHPPTPARRLVANVYNRFTESYIRNRACSTVTVARYSQDYLIKNGIKPDRIKVIHNGIPFLAKAPEAREQLRNEWGVADHDVLVGVASRLDPIKGVKYLIEAFSSIARHRTNVKLVLIGSGPLDNVLKLQVDTLGLKGRVIFTGFRADISNCLSAMDIFVLPSLAESHSIGLLEAMRAEKAIIATDVGGNTESVRHEQEALVVPPADSVALTHSLNRLLDDKSLCERLRVNAYKKFMAEFTEEHMVKCTAEWLMQIASMSLPCR